MTTVPVLFDKQRHIYTDPNGKVFPSVTQILSDSGLVDFSMVSRDVREAAMHLGTKVHWMLELQDHGALNYRVVPKALRPYRTAYLTWKERSGFQPMMIERSFLSVHGYAGTLDRFGSLPPTHQFPTGSYAVVDFKTGDGPVAEWVKYQLSAYSRQFSPDYLNVRRIALKLHSDGTYAVKEFDKSTWHYDWAMFCKCLADWKKKHGDN